ncbi:MAG TPA: hypothetical protein VFL80_13245 [Thermoanaerobaculia bacterium]|nr:hypothetical protein [Thermoanaerobaculia bacterium]
MFLSIVAGAVVLLLLGVGVAWYRMYRGTRILICPETQMPVGASVKAFTAARTNYGGNPRIVIASCSRWPERAGCDQACAPQVAASPDETLVKTIVTRWYQRHLCASCGGAIADIGGSVRPGLRGVDGTIREWSQIAPENLPEMLASSLPLCARCDLAEDFRQRFPELVVDREETPLRNRLIH